MEEVLDAFGGRRSPERARRTGRRAAGRGQPGPLPARRVPRGGRRRRSRAQSGRSVPSVMQCARSPAGALGASTAVMARTAGRPAARVAARESCRSPELEPEPETEVVAQALLPAGAGAVGATGRPVGAFGSGELSGVCRGTDDECAPVTAVVGAGLVAS